MSAYLLGIGFRAQMGSSIRKLILIKMIDACEEDGTRIFPSVGTLASAAECSTRQVRREIAAFVAVGLLRLVREGGKGPKSTNEYALDLTMLRHLAEVGWAGISVAGGDDENAGNALNKGDTVSPLAADKGDTDDPIRVTPATAKGDKLSHPTPPYPSPYPSIERERASADAGETVEEGERDVGARIDRKAIERQFFVLVKGWPGNQGMPTDRAQRLWLDLSAEDREAAQERRDAWFALLRSQKKSHFPAPQSYIKGRLWEAVEPASESPEPLSAPAFGPVWAAVRLARLIGPAPALGDDGFPVDGFVGSVRTIDMMAGRGTGLAPKPGSDLSHWERLAALMEAVPVGGDAWTRWRDEFRRRGWAWLPDPGRQPAVYFPRDLAEFERAVTGGDRAADSDAAE